MVQTGQIELTRDGRMDAMIVHVEAASDATGPEARAASARELASHIRNVVGIRAEIDVGDPGAVERSLGKARRVVDSRPKE